MNEREREREMKVPLFIFIIIYFFEFLLIFFFFYLFIFFFLLLRSRFVPVELLVLLRCSFYSFYSGPSVQPVSLFILKGKKPEPK